MVLQGGPDLRVELLDSPAGNGMPWRRGLKAPGSEWPTVRRHGLVEVARLDIDRHDLEGVAAEFRLQAVEATLAPVIKTRRGIDETTIIRRRRRSRRPGTPA